MKFSDFGFLDKNILKAIEELGYIEPTKIQQETIINANQGIDIIGQSQTGTGKTAAFGIPIINSYRNLDEESNNLEHLIIVPTRELANQIYDQLKKIAKYLHVKIALILGGVAYERQVKVLSEKPNIIIATPGRLNDYLKSKRINLNNIKTFTIDEADEILNIGFQKELELIISFLPEQKQNFFFTATMDKKTKELAKLLMNDNAIHISISSDFSVANTIKQEYIVVKEKTKLMTIVKLLNYHNPKSVVIFGRTKRRVDELNDALNNLGFNSVAIQGDMQQRERFVVMDKFRNHKKNILVATDVMARGIDVEHVEWIINFDLPQEIEYYTHRIGRAGRAGRAGYSLSLVKNDEIEHLKEIEHKTNSKITLCHIPSDSELYERWRENIGKKFSHILNNYEKLENIPTYLEDDLFKNFTHKELSILLANLLLKNKHDEKKINLTPEPSVVLKGQAKIRSIKNKINKFNKKPNNSRNKFKRSNAANKIGNRNNDRRKNNNKR